MFWSAFRSSSNGINSRRLNVTIVMATDNEANRHQRECDLTSKWCNNLHMHVCAILAVGLGTIHL